MRIGVVSYYMALVVHTFYKIRIIPAHMRKYEKRAVYLLTVQYVKRLFHVAVFISRVEGQIYHLFVLVAQIDASVFVYAFIPAVHLRLKVLGVWGEKPALCRRCLRV